MLKYFCASVKLTGRIFDEQAILNRGDEIRGHVWRIRQAIKIKDGDGREPTFATNLSDTLTTRRTFAAEELALEMKV
jgi:hypothetical protein